MRLLLAVAVVIVSIASTALIAVSVVRVREREAGRAGLAHGLALQGAELRDVDLLTARQLGAAAVTIHADDETRAALADTLVAGRRADLPDTRNVQVLALSIDGRTALTADLDRGVVVWGLEGRMNAEGRPRVKRLADLQGHGADVSAIALTPDGRTALIGSEDGSATVWGLARRAHPVRLATLEGDDTEDTEDTDGTEDIDDVEAVALTPDGRTALTAYFNGRVVVWNLSDASRPVRLAAFRAGASWVGGLGLSADGRTVVSASDGTAVVWDLTDRSHPVRLGEMNLGENYSAGLALSADGRTAVTGNWRVADVWDLSDRAHPAHVASLPGASNDVFGVALTPDGRTALTGGHDGSAIVWNLNVRSRPVRLAALKGYAKGTEAVALSGDGETALTGSFDRGASVWSLADVRDDLLHAACAYPGNLRMELDRQEWDRFADDAEWSTYADGQDYFWPC
ncbi:hypothetical protein N5079_12425 [Planotetraspora sp. A-T 1434]|uniref:WD40 repeat domain-containing protein n=1 Tax=Planotetraspora sp. A-T 1434 TaxID=2979219 RepID=UPI0021C1ADE8|nr:hypothetical protein [Planotetraspora sp. A-T 1434]MCT9931023.1 hypothetical protein [Planotetraspora sp. A-T 1434]